MPLLINEDLTDVSSLSDSDFVNDGVRFFPHSLMLSLETVAALSAAHTFELRVELTEVGGATHFDNYAGF